MKTVNAVKKLEANGYKVSEELGSYVASKDGMEISFFSQVGNTKNFTLNSDMICTPLYGLTLKRAMCL